MQDLLRGNVRRLALLATVLAMLAAGVFVGVRMTRVHAASYCSVTYTISSQWSGGFGVQGISIQNTGSAAWTSWTLTFAFPAAGQTVTQGWNGTFTQSGQNVTVASLSYNGSVAVNGSVNPSPGFNGAWTSSNPVPTSFSVNGNVCGASSTSTATPSPSSTPTTPTTTPKTPTPTTPTTTATPPTATPTTGPTAPPGTHLTNPFTGTKWYINNQWASEVKAGAATKSGTLATQEAAVANYSTFVWLDSMAAISGTNGYTMSLANHLDAAESQGATLIGLVIYDLPGRDCAALASNGEIPATAAGLQTYESSYIDPIVATINQAKYSNLHVIAVIEPDSLPNLVTNLSSDATCATVNSGNLYQAGVQYALNKLHAISNVYNYIDIGHYGWLGWTSNFQPAVTLISNVIKGTTAGGKSVDGFISDTANYVATAEPFMTANESIGGNPVRSANFYQWNTYIQQDTFDADWKSAMVSALGNSNIGMIIDTSRNGWGGSGRPTAASTSTDLNTFVNASKIDRRIAAGNWCNQPGGIGARPTASPNDSVYMAFVWVKPPGESDGSSSLIPTGPSNPGGKGFDRMCDPTYGGNAKNNNNPTGAMANAPVSGAWFQSGFDTLVQNAYPSF
jgi:cellulose 1,4-beta-cellobiosidase